MLLSVLINLKLIYELLYEPVREKTDNVGFEPGPTQTGLYCHRRMLA